MLELKDVVREYNTGGFVNHALNHVSIKFRDSEFVAILGPSGSGKTTMLNIIGGLDHFTSGDLLINGVSTKDYNEGLGCLQKSLRWFCISGVQPYRSPDYFV